MWLGRRAWLLGSAALVALACGDDDGASNSAGDDAGVTSARVDAGGRSAAGASGGRGDAGSRGGTGGSSGSGARAGSGGTRASGGSNADAAVDAGAQEVMPLPRDPCVAAGTCPPGEWINVTPPDMDGAVLRPSANAYGPGSVVVDPARPSDLYVGGSGAGLWRSTDYGNRWTLVNHELPDVPRGVVIAVAGTTPATVWAAAYNVIFKSSDAGESFVQHDVGQSLYSLTVDPYDDTHLISGLHEVDGIMESTDGGDNWEMVGGTGFPSGGKSWYPYFVDTGDAASTAYTWFAIAQDGASAVMTDDGGASWHVPDGIDGLQHPHGTSQIYQHGSTLFVAGVNGPGQGVYRSQDLGHSFTRVDSGAAPQAVVWGTDQNVYAMYAWACSHCDLGTSFEMAPQPGDGWTQVDVVPELTIGPNSVVVTSDGSHDIFVAVMWDQGIWRYVEP